MWGNLRPIFICMIGTYEDSSFYLPKNSTSPITKKKKNQKKKRKYFKRKRGKKWKNRKNKLKKYEKKIGKRGRGKFFEGKKMTFVSSIRLSFLSNIGKKLSHLNQPKDMYDHLTWEIKEES